MNIHGQDLVPIEVRYHRSCYKELLIKTVREVENLDDSVKIRGFYLNKARYPLLQFLQPIKRNSSEIVFCKESFSLLADRWTSQSDLEKMESTDYEYDSEGEGPQLDQIIIVKKVVEYCTLLVC